MIRKEEITKVGVFTKPHGIKGEIGLVASNGLSFSTDEPFVVCEIDGIYVPFFIEASRSKTSTVVLLKLAMIDSDEAARELSGKDVYCPAGILEPDGEREGEHAGDTWNSLTGYTVFDSSHGNLGEITDVDDSTINIILQLKKDGREQLIPAVEEWIHSIDHNKRQIQISVPDGLLDM